LAELKELGAVVKDQQVAMAFGAAPQYTIEIGDAWRGQAKDLSRLSWLKDVGELILNGPKVTDQCLQCIPKSGGQLALTIKRAKITDEGIKHLADVKNLQMLSLLYVPISDQSVSSLQQVAVAGKMRIYGSRMTRAGAERLQEKLAGTEVDFRQGAFLGVGCQSGEQGCVIYTVRAETAAAKADLRPQDVICEYDGKKVNDFEVLTAMISEDQSGDTVTIKILRGDEEKEIRVTLGECEE
jgi:C-terminal processing protease CtpA/Prc